jgi:ribosomal protein L16 Arg81 hydroxylase
MLTTLGYTNSSSSDAAPRIATPIPHVSAFDDEIVTIGDVRYIPPDVTHGARLPPDMDGEVEFFQSLPNARD